MREPVLDQQLIDNYLTKKYKLSPEDIELIETRLKTDEKFSEEVQLQQDIISSIQTTFDQQLKNRLKEADANKPTKQFYLRYASGVAASLIILITAIYLFYNPSQSSEQVFIAYYKVYPNIIEPTERGSQNVNNAFQLYEKGEYKSASTLFKEHILQDNNNLSAHFYLGICAIETNQIDLAKSSFLKVIESEAPTLGSPAHWYLALMYLKFNETEFAKQQLLILENSGSSYSAKASEVLKQLP